MRAVNKRMHCRNEFQMEGRKHGCIHAACKQKHGETILMLCVRVLRVPSVNALDNKGTQTACGMMGLIDAHLQSLGAPRFRDPPTWPNVPPETRLLSLPCPERTGEADEARIQPNTSTHGRGAPGDDAEPGETIYHGALLTADGVKADSPQRLADAANLHEAGHMISGVKLPDWNPNVLPDAVDDLVEVYVAVSDAGPEIAGGRDQFAQEIAPCPNKVWFDGDCFGHQFALIEALILLSVEDLFPQLGFRYYSHLASLMHIARDNQNEFFLHGAANLRKQHMHLAFGRSFHGQSAGVGNEKPSWRTTSYSSMWHRFRRC